MFEFEYNNRCVIVSLKKNMIEAVPPFTSNGRAINASVYLFHNLPRNDDDDGEVFDDVDDENDDENVIIFFVVDGRDNNIIVVVLFLVVVP